MKEFIRKIAVISILMIMIMNSPLLLIISKATDVIEEVMEKSEITPIFEMDLKKYVNYSTKNSTGSLVQINLKTNIEYGENREQNPFNSMEILLNAPKIEQEYPENIEIIAKSSENMEKVFESSYDKETGSVKIVTMKEQEEFVIIFYYGSNCYKDNQEERNLEFSGVIQANLADENNTKKEIEINQSYTVTENLSGLVSANIYTSDIYNGYINSNYQNDTSYQTQYNENLEIEISKKEMADEITIDTQNNFLNKNNEIIETNEIVYRSTKLDKNKILSILGEEGYLRILNESGEIQGEINKNTEVGEDGICEINYPNEVSRITIQISKPLKVGNILLQNMKSIKESMKDVEINRIQEKNTFDYNEKIKETKKVIDDRTNEEKEEVEEHLEQIYHFEDTHVTDIKESETKINLSVDKTDWTNNMQNDVNFTVKILANDIKYKLAKNPVIEIKLPDVVDKVVLGNVSLLYGNGLSVANAQVIDNETGKFIKVEITGNQSEYFIDSMVTGTNILIPINIILKQDIESTKRNISWTYTNDNISVDGIEGPEINIESIFTKPSEEEIQPENELQAINTMETTINSVINEEPITQVQANEINENDLEISVQAKVGDQILNEGDIVRERQVIKYSVTLTNKSDKTITGIIIEGQVPEGTTYATLDLGNYIQETYEYIKDEDVNACAVQIPNIEAGKSKTVFYEVVAEDLVDGVTQKNIANTITTKIKSEIYHQETKSNIIKKAELETNIKCYMGREGRNSFYYYLYITNLTDKDIYNVQIETNQIQKELSLVSSEFYDAKSLEEIGEINENNQYIAQIDKIEPEETRTILLIMSAGNYDDYINELPLNMTMRVSTDQTETYISNEARRNAYPEYVTISQTLDKEGEYVNVGDTVQYKYVIKNESKVRSIVQIQDKYSDYLEDVTVKYDMYNIINLKHEEQTSSDTFYDLEEEANLEYEKEPQEINVSELVNHNLFDVMMVIPAGKTLEITVTGIATDVDETTEVQNYMVVSGPDIKTRSSNISTFYIYVEEPQEPEYPDDDDDLKDPEEPEIPDDPYDPDNPEIPDDPYDPDISVNYNIKGVVWLDENRDGVKQSDEELLKGLSVKLYNANNNMIVNSGTFTNSEGEYEFNNISKGNYLVVFEYDTGRYTTTKFTQYEGNKYSSNAMEKTVFIEGQEKKAGITDIITINNASIENLNMGLIENSTFDLKLDKYINQITVKNNKTKTYQYNHSQLAKIEIPAKQIENTQVEIEYKIVVTNEGNVEAYADEIIDYIPQDVQISNATKDGWTKNSKGNLVNRNLIGQKIQPGESKELKLVVTKKMSSQNTGNVLNGAEINLSKSIDNLKDIDSTAGNKRTDEDDYSEASVIISIDTGLVKNIIIFMVIVGVISLVIITMKNVKNKKMFIFILSLALFTCVSNSVQAEIMINGNREHPFIGNDGNTYICISPGKAQCIAGQHFYELMENGESRQIIYANRESNNDAKIDKNNTKLEFKKQEDEWYLYEGQFNVTNGYFDDYELTAKYNYINEDEKEDEVNKKINVSEYITNESGQRIGGKFTLKVPETLTKLNVSLEIVINEAFVYVQKEKITQRYQCVRISDPAGHGSINCKYGIDHVQNMSRSWDIETRTPEPKNLEYVFNVKGDKIPENGKIKIIKIDEETGKLIQEEDGKTAKFKISRVNSETGKTKYLRTTDDEEGYPNLSDDRNGKNTTWDIAWYGTIDIEKVPIDKKYTYYLEEFEPKTGYILSETKTELNISNANTTEETKIKRSLNYFLTRNIIKNTIKEKALNEKGKINKEKYRRIICNLVFTDSNDINSSGIEDTNTGWYKDYEKINIDDESPTDSEIKKLISFLVENMDKHNGGERKKALYNTGELEGQIEGLTVEFTGLKSFYAILKRLDIKTDKITQGVLVKASSYLDGYDSVIISNKPAKAYIKVYKEDIDTKQPLEGAIFRVTGKSKDGKQTYDFQIETDKSGWTERCEVKFGTYEIEEIVAPSGYKINFQENTKQTIKLEPTKDNPSVEKEVKFSNKKFGVINILKVDRETNKPMQGIKFQIKRQDLGKYMRVWHFNGKEEEKLDIVEEELTLNPKYGTPAGVDEGDYHIDYVDNPQDATYFVTNGSGEISIKGLETRYGATSTFIGEPIVYQVFETDTGESLGKYYAVDGTNHDLQVIELSQQEAYIYTIETMLKELSDSKNYRFAKENILEKRLSIQERENHVVDLIRVITAHNLADTTNKNNEKLLKLIMEDYNKLYNDASKRGIDVEIEFVSNLIRFGTVKYSNLLNNLLDEENQKQCENIIKEEIKNFEGSNLGKLGDNITKKINNKLGGDPKYEVAEDLSGNTLLTIKAGRSKGDSYKYVFEIQKKSGKFQVTFVEQLKDFSTINPYVEKMLTVRDMSKLGQNDKNKVAEGLYSLYSKRALKPTETEYYVQLLEGKKILKIENTQTWISLSGYVWEDMSNSKDNTKPPSDGYYDVSTEYKIGGIPVILKDRNTGAIVNDKNGRQLITYTNGNGEYRFDYITLMRDANEVVYNLKDYYVEFQYDGFTYTSVITGGSYLTGTNTSKARETDETRTALNNKFVEVVKDSTVALDERNKVNLEYTKEGSTESQYINNHWIYEKNSEPTRKIIMARKNDTIYDCLATTKETGYEIIRSIEQNQYEIQNINLGLKSREMPNALIYNHDVDNVKVCINGHTNVYRYDQNLQTVNPEKLPNGQVAVNVSSYVRWIAPSYIQSMEDLGEDHKIKIYVTYKITLQNASNTLTMKINTLDNYYDNRYLSNNISVGDTILNDKNDPNYYGLGMEGNKKINNQTVMLANSNGNPYASSYNGYNIGIITTTNGEPITELKAQEQATMYVQYQVRDEAIKEILQSDQTLSNVIEISSYTTCYGEKTEPDTGTRRTGVRRTGELYAAVDNNSAPRNADLNKSNEYEDDTYSSPKVTLKVGQERAITGNVFEDLPTETNEFDKDKVNTGKERKGNGIYDNKENLIDGITVQLIKVDTEGENTPADPDTSIANCYPEKGKKLAQMQTKDGGSYEIQGIIPGHYIVRFTYGNETIGQKSLTAENYKSTIRTGGVNTGGEIDYEENVYWYQVEEGKPRFSDAIDNQTSREEFNEKLSVINYGNKTAFEEEKKQKKAPTVYADTNIMDVAIEDVEKAVIDYYGEEKQNGKIKNIDFGLIERPKQKFEVKKVINNVKITLANGAVLVNGNPENLNNPYVVHIKDSELVKIEVDNEILQGSKLEIDYGIKITNLSELDYSDINYQWYGSTNKEDTLVTQTITEMIDNMDSELSTEYSNQVNDKIYKLTSRDMEELKRKGKFSNQLYSNIKGSNNILKLNNLNNFKDLKPGQSGEVVVLASKMLTTTSTKDNYFINYTEVIENKNKAGKFTEDSTPGNADFKTIQGKEPDENGEALTIVPPTGGSKTWYIMGVGVIALTILVGGIILIKKKVLEE